MTGPRRDPDVARLEAERLRPSPHEQSHDWRDDLDQIIGLLWYLLDGADKRRGNGAKRSAR